MDQNKTIELFLSRSADARAFNERELLHFTEFQRVKKWIEEDLKEAGEPNDYRGGLDRDRRHDTITILGTRGSGKTSFLLSILTWFETNYASDVEVLEIIDPTLIEEKGHIFLDVLSVIKDKVDKVLDAREAGSPVDTLNLQQQWRDMIETLAHGLPHVDGIGGNLTDVTWQDPEYIMQRGLRSVKAARNLETNFTKAIGLALAILGKKAFVIAFDDIDIDFKKGWPVLELLRKYFVSKQLITLLSGDMRLYSLAVRKKQWSNFGEELIKQEGNNPERLDRLRDLVTETESQYLQKVMKPVRRVHLTTLYDKLRVHPEISVEVFSSARLHAPLNAVYEEIFKKHGIFNNYQAEMYKSFLLNSPLRLQIRFLEANTGELFADSTSFLDTFISDLYEMRVDIDRICGSPQQLNIAILELLLREKILSETNQLQPTTTKPALNGALIALTLLFSQTTERNPSLVFDYFVRIGYLRNLLSSIGYLSEERKGEDTGTVPSIQGLCKHSGILQDRVIKDNIGMVTAYMTAVRTLDGNRDRPLAGMIPLRGLAGLSKKRLDQKENRIDFVAENVDPARRALIYLPLSISQSSSRQGGTVVYSFHVLLAAIADFMRKVQHKDVFRGIAELSQLRSYPMPDFQRADGQSGEFDEQALDAEDESSSAENYHVLERMLLDWNDYYPKQPIPPHILGKISTRFFFAADAIQNAQKNEKLNEIMHALTVAFLNSVLIEDIREHVVRPDINLNNTRMSDDILINNLNKLDEETIYQLKFSRWIFSCPLLLVYLNPKSYLHELIFDFGEEVLVHEAFSLSVYHELAGVTPKYRLVKPRNYETIIKQLIADGIPVNRLTDAFSDEDNLKYLTEDYKRSYPAENMTVAKMRKILEYHRYGDPD